MQVAIIDYGMGNLRNVQKALEALGVKAVITQDAQLIEASTHIILPGVGAFCEAMVNLKALKLDQVIKHEIEKGKPFLGICLGMQLLFEHSYENGLYEGLGLLKGQVVKLDVPLKVPHMGWNTLEITKSDPLFKEIAENSYVYFVHSYHIETPEDIVSSYTEYGKRFPVAIQKENLFAMQFHPEKSGEVGRALLKQFLAQRRRVDANLSSY